MIINEKYLTEIDLYFKSDLNDCDIKSFIDRDGCFVYEYKQFDDSDNVCLINSFDDNIEINYQSCCIKTHFKDLTLEQKQSLYDKFYGTTFLLKTKTNKMIFESSPISFDKFVSIIENNTNDDIFVDMDCKIQKLYEYMFNFEAFSQKTFDIDSLQNPYENDSNDLIIEEHGRIDFFDKDMLKLKEYIYNHLKSSIRFVLSPIHDEILKSEYVLKYDNSLKNNYVVDVIKNHTINGKLEKGWHPLEFHLFNHGEFKMGVKQRESVSDTDSIQIYINIIEMIKHEKDFCSIFNHELTHVAPQWTKNEINPLKTNKSDTSHNEYLNDDFLKKKYGLLFYIMNPHEQNAFITETQQIIIDTSDDEYEKLKKMTIDDIIEYTKTHNHLYKFRNYYKFFSNIDENEVASKVTIIYIGYVFKHHELISSIKFDWLDENVYKSIYINWAQDVDGYKIHQLVSDITKKIKTVMENYERRLHHHIAYALYKRKTKQI